MDDDDRLVGLITLRDLLQRAERPEATKDARGRLAVGAAIGVRGDFMERARALAGGRRRPAWCWTSPTATPSTALRAVGEVREAVGGGVEIIAGNVATAEGARDLAEAGADAVKVGVGPGSVCTTRVVAGVGVPQLSAVMECAEACAPPRRAGDRRRRHPGGRATWPRPSPPGAETVMVGNLLAGTPESPGVVVTRNGTRVKVFRGMASERGGGRPAGGRRRATTPSSRRWCAEGVEAVVPLRDDGGGHPARAGRAACARA